MIIAQILLSLSGAYLLVRGIIESTTLDGSVIEPVMYIILYGIAAVLLLGGIFLRRIVTICKNSVPFRIVVLALAGTILALFMVAGYIAFIPVILEKPDGSENIMLVLGAPVIDNKPSIILQSRAEAAAEWVKEHPETYVVISGGKGTERTEAQVIADIMIEKGADDERIFLEDRATTTSENFSLTKELLSPYVNVEKETLVVLTNHFHTYRMGYYADGQGFYSVKYLPVPTPESVRLIWYTRETILTIMNWYTGL